MAALRVYASEGGDRYHSRWSCPALVSGQMLSDHDCWCVDICAHDHRKIHPALGYGIEEMAESGRTPCRACAPPLPAAEDFGHVPLLINENRCGGCEVCGTEEEQEVCARCFPMTYEPGWAWVLDPDTDEMVSRFGRWPTPRTVPWPCATAAVLGLPTDPR